MESGNQIPQWSAFEDKAIRLGFIRKVYSILSLELFLTFGAVLAVTFVRDNNEREVIKFANDNYWVLIVAAVGMIVLCITLSCFEKPRRTHPWNLILLATFVVFTSVLLCFATLNYKSSSILIATGMTMAIVVGLTMFAMQTKIDFTVYYTLAFVCLLVLTLFGILAGFFYTRMAELGIGVAGSLLFSFYIVIDTQMIVGGHKFQISPEEYILASLTLYLDVVNLFLYLLRIFGRN